MNKFVWKKNSAKKNVTFYPLFDSINIDCVVVVAFAMYTKFSPFSFYSGKPIEGFCNYCRYFFFDLTKWNWHFSKKKDEAWKAIRIKTNRKQFNAAQRINRNKKKNKQRTSLMYKTKLSKQIQSWNDDLIRFFVDVVVAGCCWLWLSIFLQCLLREGYFDVTERWKREQKTLFCEQWTKRKIHSPNPIEQWI